MHGDIKAINHWARTRIQRDIVRNEKVHGTPYEDAPNGVKPRRLTEEEIAAIGRSKVGTTKARRK